MLIAIVNKKCFFLFIYLVYTGLCGFTVLSCVTGISDSILPIIGMSQSRVNPRFLQVNKTAGTTDISQHTASGITLIKRFNATYELISERKFLYPSITNSCMVKNKTTYIMYNNALSGIVNYIAGQNYSYYKPLLGNSAAVFFQFINIGNSTNYYKRNFSSKLIVNNISYYISSANGLYLQLQGQKVFFYTFTTPINGTATVYIFSATLAVPSFSYSVILDDPTSLKFGSNTQYIAVGQATKLYLHNHSANNIWNINIPDYIQDIEICGLWVFASTIPGNVYQIEIASGNIISKLSTLVQSPHINIVDVNSSCSIFIWKNNESVVLKMSIDGINQNSNNNCSNNPPINNFVQVQTKQTRNICNSYNQGTCLQFCNNMCQYCSQQKQCGKCDRIYSLSQGKCSANLHQKIILTIAALLYTFRVEDLQRFYLFFNELQFHSYHKVNYTGVVKEIIEYMQIFKENLWSIIKLYYPIALYEKSFHLPGYSAFTNEKFMYVQRSDCFFFQTTKNFFLFYTPLIITLYLLMYLFFKVTARTRVAKFIFKFSSMFGIIMIIVVQNVSNIIFLGFHHLKCFFSFNFILTCYQSITIISLFLFILLPGCYFYFQGRFYRKKKKLLSKKTKSLKNFVLLFRYFIKPIITSAGHVYLYEIYNYQILFISLVSLITFFLCSGFQMWSRKSKVKLIYVGEYFLDLTLALFNFILYLRHWAYFGQSQQLDHIFERFLVIIVYTLVSIFAISIIRQVFESACSLRGCFIKNPPKNFQKKKSLKQEQNASQNCKSKSQIAKPKILREITLIKVQKIG